MKVGLKNRTPVDLSQGRVVPIKAKRGSASLTWISLNEAGGEVRRDVEELGTGYSGSNKLKDRFAGRPKLASDLIPAIQDLVRGKSGEVLERAMVALRHFFRYLDFREAQGGTSTKCIEDVSDDHGSGFRRYLISTPRRTNTQILGQVAKIINGAKIHRELSGVSWPIIEKGQAPTVHVDVSPLAISRLRAYALRRLSAKPSISARDEALFRRYLKEEIEDGAVSATTKGEIEEHYRSRRSEHHARFGEKTALIEACAQSAMQAMAGYLVVAIETGWLDAATAINVSSDKWFVAQDANTGPSGRVLVVTPRPKTKVRLDHPSTRSRNSIYGVISRAQARSKTIRDHLIARREKLLAAGEAQRSNRILYLNRLIRSPWLYVPLSGASSEYGACALSSVWKIFVDLKNELLSSNAAAAWSAEDREAIQRLTISDCRDAFAARVFEKTEGNLFAVKAALGHRRTSSTTHYLRQLTQVKDAFSRFRLVTGVMLGEVGNAYNIDPKILMARCYPGRLRAISLEQRIRVTAIRTRLGTGCNSPTSPPPELSANHAPGKVCSHQRCVLCQNAVFYPAEAGALEALAVRYGEVLFFYGMMPTQDFMLSILNVEKATLEALRDALFSEQVERFERLAGAVVEEMRAGIRPVPRF